MYRVLILLKRKPGMTFEDFRSHYESSHVRLGEKYFGHLFESYRRSYIPAGVRLSDGRDLIENEYDCITELVFKDVRGYEELKRLASDPEIHRVLVEDEELFLDREACANAISDVVESDLSQYRRH